MGLRRERRGGRFILILLIMVSIAVAALVFVGGARRDAAIVAQDRLGRERVNAAAEELAALIQPAITETQQLARLIGNARAAGNDREIIKGLAVPSLDLRPEFLGTGVIFEPNAFDGRDADYVGQSPENDRQGRFSAYYYKDPGKPTVTAPLDIADAPGAENWYQTPLKTARPYLLQPFSYPVNGTDVWLSTVSVPVLAEGEGVGVALMDFRMTEIVSRVQKLKGDDFVGAWMISGDGTWVVNSNSKKVGKSLELYDPGPEGEIEALRRDYNIPNNTAPLLRVAQNGTRYFLKPIPLEGIDQHWLVAVAMPKVDTWGDMPKDGRLIAGTLVSVIFVVAMVFLEYWLHGRGNTTAPQPTAARKVTSVPTSSTARAKRPMQQVRREPTVRRR